MNKSKYFLISVLVLGVITQFLFVGCVNAAIFQPKPPPPNGDPQSGPPIETLGPIEILLSVLYLILLVGTIIAILVKKSKRND